MTVIKKNKKVFCKFIEETLKVTTAIDWQVGTQLNIEKSRKRDEIAGHFVSGHVDCITKLKEKKNIKKI